MRAILLATVTLLVRVYHNSCMDISESNLHRLGPAFCGAVNRIAVYSGSGPVSLPTTTAGPTSTTNAQTTTTPASGAQQTHWGQCGGKTVSLVRSTFPVGVLTVQCSIRVPLSANRLGPASTPTISKFQDTRRIGDVYSLSTSSYSQCL